jgi:hypothetical protein
MLSRNRQFESTPWSSGARVAAMLCMSLALLLPLGDARATSLVPLDLDRMIAGSQHIVHVRAIANAYEADPTVRVATVTTFVVLDRVKGAPGATFTVRQIGGELNGVVSDYRLPKFNVGEEYVLFMPGTSRLGFASPVGLAQGVFSVMGRHGTKEVGNGRDFSELLPRANAATLPAGIGARLRQSAGERERQHVDLADFLNVVRARTPR